MPMPTARRGRAAPAPPPAHGGGRPAAPGAGGGGGGGPGGGGGGGGVWPPRSQHQWQAEFPPPTRLARSELEGSGSQFVFATTASTCAEPAGSRASSSRRASR